MAMDRDSRIQLTGFILLATVILVAALSIHTGLSAENLDITRELLASSELAVSERDSRIAELQARLDSAEAVLAASRQASTITMSAAYQISMGSIIIKNARKGISERDAADLSRIIFEESARGKVDFAFMLATIEVESRFATNLVSPAGATGLGQLMPGTAERLARRHGIPYSIGRLYNPRYNAMLSAKYVAALDKLFSTPEMVAAAYNAGPGGANRYAAWKRGELSEDAVPAETRAYVGRVMGLYREYRGIFM